MPSNFSCLVRRPRQGETLKGGESGLPRPGRRELDPHLRPCQHRSYLRFHTSTRASARAWMHMSCATEPPEYPCKPCHSAVVRCTRAPKQVCMPSFATHHLFLLLYLLLHPRPHALSHALIFRRCAQYLPVDHAVATIVPAPCCSRACVVRLAQVDMLHVMQGDGGTDRANG